MMNIYLVRHGEAVSSAADGQRPLSDIGRRSIERLGRHIAQHCIKTPLRFMFHSPKARAKETAEILNGFLSASDGCKETAGLLPDDSPEELMVFARSFEEDIMIVSHLPLLNRFINAALLYDKSMPVIPHFKQGTFVHILRNADNNYSLQKAIDAGQIEK